MWRCLDCGAEFDEQNIRIRWENMDGENGWQEWHELTCANCGSENIDEKCETEECEK